MSTDSQHSDADPDPESTPDHDSAVPARRMVEKARRAEDDDRGRTDDRRREAADADRTRHLRVFRYDPDVAEKQEPYFDDFHVPYEDGMTVLDALIYARDEYDSSLTFRHSCRQAICGSCAMFLNGQQRLACKTQLSALDDPVRVEPLPHQPVVKDLVVDMEHFYEQMEAVEPYFQGETPDDELTEQRQSRENREEIKMSTRCIWCGACMSACNVAAGNNEYLGPAAINKAYRFVMDDREEEAVTERRMDILSQENGVWRCQTQFSCTEVCPKDIPLTEHIQELKREAVKSNLKFW